MKIRNGFVSNSSSSSFICDACGAVESGMDCSLEDMGFLECVNGHTFCEDHKLKGKGNGSFEDMKATAIEKIKKMNEDIEANNKKYIAAGHPSYVDELIDISLFENAKSKYTLNDLIENYIDEGESEGKETLESECPICTLSAIPDRNVLLYMLKIHNKKLPDVISEIKNQFKNYKDLSSFLKK